MSERIKTLDIIRSLSIFPIVHFHSWEIVFFENKLLPELFYQPHHSMYNYSRYFSFSGFTIVFLFYFLMGFKNRALSGLASKAVLFSLGFVTLSSVCAVAFDSELFLEWDIYHFLIFSFLILVFLKNRLKGSLFQMGLWCFLACIPFWKFKYAGLGADVLVGDCLSGTGMWPLLPGLFLVFLAFTLGQYTKAKQAQIKFSSSTLAVLIGLAGLVVISIEHFRFTPIGSGFGCFIHRPPFWVWSLTVLSLCSLFYGASNVHINQIKVLSRLSDLLSRLEWNRHFGLCYLTQWLFLFLLYLGRSFFVENPGCFFVAPLAVIVLTEGAVRLELWLYGRSSIYLK